jgi:hypothetical protein
VKELAYRAAVTVMSATIVILILAGCAAMPPADLDDRVRSACTVYRSTLSALAVQNRLGNITAEQEQVVDAAIVQIRPWCQPGATVAAGPALDTIEAALIRMIEAKEEATRHEPS